MDDRRLLGIPFWPAVVLVAALLAGTVAGALYPYPEWHMAKRALFGGFMGGFCGVTLTASRILR